MRELLRYLDPVRGPITRLESSVQPSPADPLRWYSLAKLHPSVRPGAEIAGAGWSLRKETSQCKAIVEAVERWAFFSLEHDKDAGFSQDRTSTGFAACPASYGDRFALRTGCLEAVERWIMTLLVDGHRLWLRPVRPERLKLLRRLFDDRPGKLLVFRSACRMPRPFAPEIAHFALVIFRYDDGGIIPGSACGGNLDEALERAFVEAFNHVRKIERVRARQELLEPKFNQDRLWHFVHDKADADRVLDKVREATRMPAELLLAPPAVLCRTFQGEWSPEISVARVLLRGVPSMAEGGVRRFLV